MGDPPSEAPSLHSIPNVEVVLKEMSSMSDTGGSGFEITVAPCPIADSNESPLILVAITLARMSKPYVKSKGVAMKVARGIVQVKLETIKLVLPSQSVIS